MKTFCDLVVTDVMPTLRSLLANELMQTYGFSQLETSKALGITQPAISQYKRGLRGTKLLKLEQNKPVMEQMKKLAAEIATSKTTPSEIHLGMCKIFQAIVKENIFDTADVQPGICYVMMDEKA